MLTRRLHPNRVSTAHCYLFSSLGAAGIRVTSLKIARSYREKGGGDLFHVRFFGFEIHTSLTRGRSHFAGPGSRRGIDR